MIYRLQTKNINKLNVFPIIAFETMLSRSTHRCMHLKQEQVDEVV